MVSKMATKPSTYERLGTVAIQDVFDLLPPADVGPVKMNRMSIIVMEQSVKVGSLRMQTFIKKGVVCSRCKLEASFFAVERHAKRGAEVADRYHLNLWGVKKGREVLFTHDHTIARCNGGADNISNTTTMCNHCNSQKATEETRHLHPRLLPTGEKKERRLEKVEARMAGDPVYRTQVELQREMASQKKISK